MRQVFRKIPVYTGDVSGVCSALFELGGMVVMHDPSGCNSTYNTHDEIRWYDHDSLIFLSGLDEMDAVMGSDDRLIHDIAEAARIYAPEFIAVANSPIPYITGMDFDAVCRAVEQETGIPSFYISTNGMHDYVHGAGLALLRIAERFTATAAGHFATTAAGQFETTAAGKLTATAAGQFTATAAGQFKASPAGLSAVSAQPRTGLSPQRDEPEDAFEKSRITCNLLGMTPLDFAHPSTMRSLCSKLAKGGVDILSCWAMDDQGGSGVPGGKDHVQSGRIKKSKKEKDPEPDAGKNAFKNPGIRNGLLERIMLSPEADVNILLSSVGYPVASCMYEKYGIPFVAGIPAEGVEKLFFEAVYRAVQTGQNQFPFRERSVITGCRKAAEEENAVHSDAFFCNRPSVSRIGHCENKTAEHAYCFIGEPVTMSSLAAQTAALNGSRTYVFGPTEGASVFFGAADSPLRGEEEIRAALEHLMENGCTLKVVADPCYADALPEGCGLLRLPHLAFSGRIFLDEIPDLMRVSIDSLPEQSVVHAMSKV